MEGRLFYGDAADFYRLKLGNWGEAVFAEAPQHVEELGLSPDTAEFEGDLATRMMGGIAEGVAVGLIGEFNYEPVHGIGEFFDFLQYLRPFFRELRKCHGI